MAQADRTLRATPRTSDEGVFKRFKERINNMKTKTLAQYVAEYIQEELYRGVIPSDIDSHLIQQAIDAYEGGAAEGGQHE